jgi:hypothetical protein
VALWLTLTALYAWQCIVWLPGQSAAFVPSLRRWAELRARGARWMSPWPGALGVTATRIPFHVRGERLVADVPLARSAGAVDATPREIALHRGSSIEVRGTRVAFDGRPFLPATSRAQARVWLWIAAALARVEPAARSDELARHLAASLDGAALGRRLGEARRTVRWLAAACNGLACAIFAIVPVAGAWVGAERAIFVSAPALLVLHGVALALAARAHRKLFPDQTAERREEIWTAALYPPALLRLPQRWVDAALAGHHPLAVARALWPEPRWRDAWSRELAWLEVRAEDDPGRSAWYRAQRAALIEAGADLGGLCEPRRRSDPTAESYCPICWDDFRAGFRRCRPCGARTIVYESVAGGDSAPAA